jgi:hypothetical protein
VKARGVTVASALRTSIEKSMRKLPAPQPFAASPLMMVVD